MQKFNLAGAIRTIGSAEVLETISIATLIKEIGATKMVLVENLKGQEFIQLTNEAKNQRFSIMVMPKANSQGEGIAELLNNNVIYCGQSDKGNWLRLSRAAVANKPKEVVDVAAFLAGVKPAAGVAG